MTCGERPKQPYHALFVGRGSFACEVFWEKGEKREQHQKKKKAKGANGVTSSAGTLVHCRRACLSWSCLFGFPICLCDPFGLFICFALRHVGVHRFCLRSAFVVDSVFSVLFENTLNPRRAKCLLRVLLGGAGVGRSYDYTGYHPCLS